MSQPYVSTMSKHSKEQSNLKSIGAEKDLSDVITDVVPLSIIPVHANPMRKVRTSSRKGKPSKVSTFSSPSMTARNVNAPEPPIVVKKPQSMTSLYLDSINIEPNVDMSKDCTVATNVMEDVEAFETSKRPRSVTTLSKSSMIVANIDDVDKNIRVLISQVLGIDPKTNVVPSVSTSLAQLDNNTENPMEKFDVNVPTPSPEQSKDKERSEEMTGDLGDKDKNPIEKNDQPTDIVNIEELGSDDVPIGQRLDPGIAKRLKNKKGQAIESSSTPSKSIRKRASVGPTKRWSKMVTPVSKNKSLKRKESPYESSESNHDVKHNVHDIISTSRKQASRKKIPANIPEVLIDNISFHFVENVEKWKFVYQTRLALERELEKDYFECKEVMSLIQEDGLMKNVTGFGKCYEMLVKEFIVNISKECDNKRSKEFRKVYVRGRCVDFSPEIINRFLGRNGEEQVKIEVSNNVICREITAKQVKEWPRKGRLSSSALSVKYVVLHRIGAINWVPTNHTSNIATGLGKFIYIV
ncbi:uncharacterized protein LOC127137791 [Lathyrus oleraceus]|uniref:uncharacterized protein LOC127137791 n=1 Tax=Pisum sativum TaxID=3888 RepID=UPI0021CF2D0D|nr:uncharacterized protein LOC127137791 [Pisum sativum]